MKSNIRYISWNKSNNKWVVNAPINGKRTYLGAFANLDDAKDKLRSVNIEIEFANGNSVYKIDEEYFNKIDTPEKAFWLGFICADGSIYKAGSENNSLALKISQNNEILLNRFKKDVKSNSEVRIDSDNQYYFITYNKNFITHILDNGKTYIKEDLKNIPTSIKEDLKKYFIRGYFEGDGSVFKSNNSLGFQVTGYLELINDIAKYIKQEIGSDIGIYKDNSIYSINVSGNKKVPLIMDLLYNKVDESDFPKFKKYKQLCEG